MVIADQKEKIKQIIMSRGPIIPSQISKELNTNILFASAMLSELVDNGHLRLTHVKVGGSPVYYLPSQESLLQSLYSRLNDKQKRTYDLLKDRKVLHDRSLDPVQRLSLRDMKDFAHPLEVEIAGETDIFWKWYLITTDEATSIIKEILEKRESAQKQMQDSVERARKMQEEAEMLRKRKEDEHRQEQRSQVSLDKFQQRQDSYREAAQQPVMQRDRSDSSASETLAAEDEKNILEDVEKRIIEERKKSNIFSKILGIGKKKEDEAEEPKAEQAAREYSKEEIRKIEVAKEFIENNRRKAEKTAVEREKAAKKEARQTIEPEKEITEEVKSETFRKKALDDEFLNELNKFFNKNGIKVMDFSVVRKKSEMDFILSVPTAVGEMEYYCKAKNKTKCNEGDLSTAFVQAQMKKLPAIFLTTGDLTKKASDMLGKEFKGMSFKKMA